LNYEHKVIFGEQMLPLIVIPSEINTVGCLYQFLNQMSYEDKSLIELFCGKTTTTVLRPFFRDHLGEPVPEENFWALWCKGRLTEANTPTVRLAPLHPE